MGNYLNFGLVVVVEEVNFTEEVVTMMQDESTVPVILVNLIPGDLGAFFNNPKGR